MKIRFVLLILVLLAQVAWLGSQYAARSAELETAPCMKIRVGFYDPRDFFRGHYQSVNCSQELPPDSPVLGRSFYLSPDLAAAWGDSRPPTADPAPDAVAIQERYTDYRATLFWKQGGDGIWEMERAEARGSAAAQSVGGGELATAGKVCVQENYVSEEQDSRNRERTVLRAELSHPLRFYVPEQDDSLRGIWYATWGRDKDFPDEKLELTADVAVRPDGSVVPKQLYVNGTPWSEYLQLIREKKVLLPES